MKEKKGVFSKIKAYRLDTQLVIAVILFLVFCGSFAVYRFTDIRDKQVMSELVLALFTSILVSFLTVVVDIIVEYKKHKNDEYLENLREYGIGNLHLNKEAILSELFHDCDRKMWVSGYRLILTAKFKLEIKKAIERGSDFYALLCPPWTEAFQMVYGDNEKVMDNYLKLFEKVNEARVSMEKGPDHVKVVFVNKPIFSDTYRIDQRVITGPYMHNKDPEYHVLMAKDFFSYELVRESELSRRVSSEYITLFQEAVWELDWDRFEKVCSDIAGHDYRESEKIDKFKDAIVDYDRSWDADKWLK